MRRLHVSKTKKTTLGILALVALAAAAAFVFMANPVLAQTPTATVPAPAPTATPVPFTAKVEVVAMYPAMGEINPTTSRPVGVTAPRGDDPKKTYAVFGPGHTNVPLGVPVYVQAGAISLAQGGKLTDYTWTLKAASGSTAVITKTAKAVPGLGLDTASFTPDKDGQYVVSLIVKDDKGSTSKAGEITFTTAKYVGNEACATCHKAQYDNWKTTAHGTAFQNFVDQNAEGEYFTAAMGSQCARCHTVGFYPVAASTGGFWDVFTNVLKLDWFKSPLDVANTTKDAAGKETTTKTHYNSISDAVALNAFGATSTFASLDPKLQAVSNIGCESCHGPAGAHVAKPGKDTAPVAEADSSSCMQCHNAGGHHTRGGAVANSAHANNADLAEGDRKPCNSCHSPEGAVDTINGVAADKTRAMNGNIGCATCHDPHAAKNAFQLRMVDSVKLPTLQVKDAGLSAICMQCHNNRTDPMDPKTGVASAAPSYPHYSSASEMVNGVGGYDFGVKLKNGFHTNIGKGVINDEHTNQPGNEAFTQVNAGQPAGACVTCHMYRTPGGVWDTKDSLAVPGHQQIGGHTFAMVTEVNGKEVQHTEPCQQCHPGIKDFNFPASADYDGNGKTEGVQTEVKGLLELTKKAVLDKSKAENIPATFQDAYPYIVFPKDAKPSLELKGALYNMRYVLGVVWSGEGAAATIHNFDRSVGLLQVSIAKLTGKDIPNATLLYTK